MKIEIAEPPMIEEIRQVFPNRPKNVVYAFGDTIYAPDGGTLPPAIVAHEAAHGQRQLACGPEVWWRQYLEDPEFRYREELVAHASEFRAQFGSGGDRNMRTCLMVRTVMRLLAPMYAYGKAQRTAGEATADLRREVKKS